MKESIVRALLVLMMCMFSGMVSANGILFQKTVQENWDALKESLVADDAIVGDKVKTEIISEYAYATEKGRKTLPAEMNKETYEAQFRQKNGFKDDLIPVATFYKQSAAGKVVSPFDSAPQPVAQEQTGAGSVDPKELQAMNQRLEKLGREIAKVAAVSKAADTKLADQATKRMAEIGAEVASIKKQLDGYTRKVSTDKIAGDVAKLQSTVNELEKKVEAVQGSPILKFGNVVIVAVGALGALVLLALGLGAINHRRVTSVKKEVAATKAEVGKIREDVANNAQAIAEVDERVTGLEKDLFPGNTLMMSKEDATLLIGRLGSLAVGDEHTHLCRLEDGTQYRVLFTRQKGEYVTIKGIADQQEKNLVGIRNVPTRLRLAAKKGQFTDRWMRAAVA